MEMSLDLNSSTCFPCVRVNTPDILICVAVRAFGYSRFFLAQYTYTNCGGLSLSCYIADTIAAQIGLVLSGQRKDSQCAISRLRILLKTTEFP